MPASHAANIHPSALRLLLSGILQCSPPELITCFGHEVSSEHFALWQQALPRLLDHEPVQYILGKAWFYGMELDVNPSVLIPRPETEGLVELVLPMLATGARVLDIGTGSGAIAITIKKLFPTAEVHATDIDTGALETANANAQCLGCDICFHICDLMPDSEELWDIIISNPPYITVEEFATLDAEVRLWEPSQALLAGCDGLDVYRRLIPLAFAHLKPGGLLALEHGYSQREAITRIARDCGYKVVFAGEDLAGRHRYLILGFPDPGY